MGRVHKREKMLINQKNYVQTEFKNGKGALAIHIRHYKLWVIFNAEWFDTVMVCQLMRVGLSACIKYEFNYTFWLFLFLHKKIRCFHTFLFLSLQLGWQ